MAQLARQLKDLSDHCLAVSWRLDLQEQTLGLKLSEVSTKEPEGTFWKAWALRAEA